MSTGGGSVVRENGIGKGRKEGRKGERKEIVERIFFFSLDRTVRWGYRDGDKAPESLVCKKVNTRMRNSYLGTLST